MVWSPGLQFPKAHPGQMQNGQCDVIMLTKSSKPILGGKTHKYHISLAISLPAIPSKVPMVLWRKCPTLMQYDLIIIENDVAQFLIGVSLECYFFMVWMCLLRHILYWNAKIKPWRCIHINRYLMNKFNIVFMQMHLQRHFSFMSLAHLFLT